MNTAFSNMSVLALCICLVVCQLAYSAPAGEYDKKYELVDVDKILSNPRIRQAYVNCMIDKGPCSPEAKDIKKILPEVLETSCAKCSDGLKKNVRKTINVMREKHPQEWAQVVNRYDPKKTHAKDLEIFLKA